VMLAAVCALPFLFSSLRMSVTDSVYEAVSGLSTTGGTVIVGLDNAPPGILLWRALLNWFGGVGIIVMAITILPVLRVGGMQLFRTESSDRSEKPFTTLRETANAITATYILLTIASALLFHLAGMGWFDAVCHAMAALSTGGFSTKDSSLGWFNSDAVLWVATFSMLAGALPLTWYIRLLRERRVDVLFNSQVHWLVGVIVVATLAMTAWVHLVVGLAPWQALSHAAVNVTSIITDAGLVSTDYGTWGSFAVTAFFFFYFIGGCTGSTSGSIKIFRWEILFESVKMQLKRMMRPHRVVVPLYAGKKIDADVIESVVNFVSIYIITFTVFSLVMAAIGLDFITATSSIASAMAGAGPGLGPIVGPAGTFQPLPDAAKWVLCAAMLLGRLEIFTVLVLLTRGFWKE
ncbi:MAG TPA: TrkH family potassium uptake protein, partial [Azospirillaceae bacterium]|nr:TrkH family potassium uptake protein [Azospirillaceae bacterium]